MNKQHFTELTKSVYRLTLLFPKKEPLRYKMREAADEILASFVKGMLKDAVSDFEVLDTFFEVAKAQNWVKQDEVLEVQNNYDSIKRDIERSGVVNSSPTKEGLAENQIIKKRSESELQDSKKVPERQKRILSFLKEQGRAQVWQTKEIMPEVTKRTLRRDFEALLKQGLIERIGERNNTFYQIKTS